MPEKSPQLWKIRLLCADAEEYGWKLTELGISAFETASATEIVCFLKANQSELSAFLKYAETAGFSCAASESMPETNWVQHCRELWQPVEFGTLKIVPVLDETRTAGQPFEENEIGILPAMGFGTGHNATTNMILDLVQHTAVKGLKPQSCLDIGTGSGILALAAAKLYDINVDAFDNDSLAVANAVINVGLNNMERRVQLRCCDITQPSGCYDLVLANLYAEILCRHAETMVSLTRSGGMLIISGIMETLLPEVSPCYSAPRWERVAELRREGWCALLLQKTVQQSLLVSHP